MESENTAVASQRLGKRRVFYALRFVSDTQYVLNGKYQFSQNVFLNIIRSYMRNIMKRKVNTPVAGVMTMAL
jgi:hypothetical protein